MLGIGFNIIDVPGFHSFLCLFDSRSFIGSSFIVYFCFSIIIYFVYLFSLYSAGHSLLFTNFSHILLRLPQHDKITMKTTMTSTATAVISLFAASVAAHGNITFPPARLTGPGMVAACGQAAVDAVLKDGTIPLEDVTSPAAGCKLSF